MHLRMPVCVVKGWNKLNISVFSASMGLSYCKITIRKYIHLELLSVSVGFLYLNNEY